MATLFFRISGKNKVKAWSHTGSLFPLTLHPSQQQILPLLPSEHTSRTPLHPVHHHAADAIHLLAVILAASELVPAGLSSLQKPEGDLKHLRARHSASQNSMAFCLTQERGRILTVASEALETCPPPYNLSSIPILLSFSCAGLRLGAHFLKSDTPSYPLCLLLPRSRKLFSQRPAGLLPSLSFRGLLRAT